MPDKKSSSKYKKCLIVLGMHRSGTSAVSGTLNILGYDLGKKVLSEFQDNPKGFFENKKITDLNEAILINLYASWHDTLLIPDKWWEFELFEWHQNEIIRILEREFENSTELLIKDPRISILLPLYLMAFEKCNIEPVFIICLRNPFEIAESLWKRNNLSREKSLMLWMDYLLKSEFYTRKFPRIFLHFDDFLNDPVYALYKIKFSLNLGFKITGEIEKKIHAFIDNHLKHYNYKFQISESDIPVELAGFYSLLVNSGQMNIPEKDQSEIDKFRKQFKSGLAFYHGLPEKYEAEIVIYFDSGQKLSSYLPVRYGFNSLVIEISPLAKVTKIVLKPVNCCVRIGIKMIDVSDSEGITRKLEDILTNATFESEKGILTFETEMPQLVLKFKTPETFQKSTFGLFYLSFGRSSLQNRYDGWNQIINNQEGRLKKVKFKKVEITHIFPAAESELNNKAGQVNKHDLQVEKLKNDLLLKSRKISQLNNKVKQIHSSITWKTGNSLIRPLSYLYDQMTGFRRKKK